MWRSDGQLVTGVGNTLTGDCVLLRQAAGRSCHPVPCGLFFPQGWRALRSLREWIRFLLWLALPVGGICGAGELPDFFETPDTRWELADYDVVPRVQIRRAYDQAHRGNASESIRIEAGSGSYVHFRYVLDPMPVHDDLKPRVWVKTDRPGVQLQAVVVLPRSLHPRTGQPLRTMIAGTVTDGSTSWQELTIEEPRTLLSQKLPHLYQQFGTRVDPREAYLDAVVLNAYGGLGVTNLWIDDLDVEGYVPPAVFGNVAEPANRVGVGTVAGANNPLGSVPAVRLESGVLFVDNRPFMPRAIDFNGESFEWLKGLGFNTIRLSLPPTNQQLREAQKRDLWFIAPPGAGPETAGGLWGDRVLAWDLGEGLTGADRESLRRAAEGVRQRDPLHRPTVCGPRSGYWDLSQYSDILMLQQNVIGTTFELDHFGEFLQQRRRLARPGKLCWAGVQTQTPRQLDEQFVLLGAGNGTAFGLSSDQLRMMAYQALSAGVRGFCFRSRTRLDSTDAATQMRALTLKRLNHELKLLRPWVTMGTFVEALPTRDERAHVTVLQTRRSRLALVLARGSGQQHVLAPMAPGLVAFDLYGIPATDRLYGLSATGPRELRRHHGPRVTQQDPDRVGLIALTEDSAVRNHIAQYMSLHGREMVQLRTELLRGGLSQTRLVDQSITAAGQGDTQLSQSLVTVDSHVQRATQMWLAGDVASADGLARRGEQLLDQVRQTHWRKASEVLPSVTTSPYCLLFRSLPSHWRWLARIRTAKWSPNALAAGDFESLPQMLSSGWKQQREPVMGLAAAVELSVTSPWRGRTSLHLRVWPESTAEPPEVVETAPVVIHSAPVPVRASQWIRIHGWVHVPEAIRGSHDGLAIYDNLGGWDLAERVRQGTGWREFMFYRASKGDRPLVISFALTGMGEAWIDDLSVSLWDQATGPVGTPTPDTNPAGSSGISDLRFPAAR